MKHNVTPELLHKYIDGNCTAEELLMLYKWYDGFEDSRDPFEELTRQEQQALKMLMFNKFKASVVLPEAPITAYKETQQEVKVEETNQVQT